MADAKPKVSLTDLIGSLNPNVADIGMIFYAFGHIPPDILKAMFSALDEQMVQKIALWAQTFVQHMNDLHFKPDESGQAGEAGDSIDFEQVMERTKFLGDKMSTDVLVQASSTMTLALKAENWKQAVWVGVSLGRMLPV